MARLTTVRPKVGAGKPRIDNSVADARRHDAVRRAEQDWRRWYKTKAWSLLRDQVLIRDGMTCCQTGVPLVGRGRAPNAPVVDHRRPHRGDRARFFDPGNCQSVSKLWHDSVKQAIERAAQSSGAAQTHPEWIGRSLVPVVLVAGPPCAGKSTLVRSRRVPGDLVLDLDEIASMLSGQDLHGWDRRRWLGPALRARNAVLAQLGRRADWPRVWFIVSEPKAEVRDWWRRALGVSEVVVVAPDSVGDSLARMPAGRGDGTRSAISRWWRDYSSDPRDEVVSGR